MSIDVSVAITFGLCAVIIAYYIGRYVERRQYSKIVKVLLSIPQEQNKYSWPNGRLIIESHLEPDKPITVKGDFGGTAKFKF